PLDSLRESLMKTKKSKVAKSLAHASSLLEKKKYSEARKAAQPITSNSIFSDHAYYLIARSYLDEALHLARTKKLSTARELAVKSLAPFGQAGASQPYSPLS